MSSYCCWQCKYYMGSFSEIVEFMGERTERFWGECKLHKRKVYENEEACENFEHRYSKEVENMKGGFCYGKNSHT